MVILLLFQIVNQWHPYSISGELVFLFNLLVGFIWLSTLLSNGKIYKNSFSKYGEAYKREIINIDRKEIGRYV